MYYNIYSPNNLIASIGHASCPLLGAAQGCIGECAAGISVYSSAEYAPPQSHPYQEGFYVISGDGYAKVNDDEFHICPGMSFLVPYTTSHTIRSSTSEPITVFWFHSA